MSRPWISETDMEVTCFHPVCSQAIQEALVLLDMDNNYKVEHHRYVGSLEMDLVISNKTTNRIFCVIEVKRTIPAVYSSRYQYQAMSYVQSLRDVEKETNYYILTNLECSCLFLYSAKRPNVYDQLITPGYIFTHRFDEVDEATFRKDLTAHFKLLISTILGNNTNYLLSFSNFATIVKDAMPSSLKWNSSIAYMFYEYIRGSFNEIGRRELYDIRQYRNDILSICREASRINFSAIFGLDNSNYSSQYKPEDIILSDLYKLGQNYKDADLLCNVMHQVISSGHSHEGEVPTDIELAQTLISIVKTFVPSISDSANITDPAAGSGTLLSAASAGYPTLQPRQIQANDVNNKLLQLLSLRMGLNFASTLNRNNSPKIESKDICDLDKSFFVNTEIVVLNPPYYSAVADGCSSKKESLANRIKQLSGVNSVTNIGQAPLECPFIELITNLVNPGTLIACIIPNTHISALGQADVEFRKFLLDQFGLCMIFNFPQTNLFDDVAQNTSIFIGKAFRPQTTIKFVQSLSLVSEIKQNTIPVAIENLIESNEPIELVDGLVGSLVSSRKLKEKVIDGWKFLDSTMSDVHHFVDEHIKNNEILFCNIQEANYGKMARGKVGNSGGSDLLYITTKSEFLNECSREIKESLKAGLRNSDFRKFIVGKGDQQFFDVRGINPDIVKNAISLYLSKYETQQKQSKKSKSIDAWYEILKKESSHAIPVNAVLLPRGTRRFASTYVTSEPTYLSTNLIAIETPDERTAKILASWMCSIFYQLQLEIHCKNQGGMRKLEVENVNKTYVPKISAMSDEEIETIVSTEINDFYDLRNPAIRPIDIAWAKVITKNDNVEGLLDEAVRYLTILAINREI